MADVVNQQTRSRMMAGIRGKNTKPEMTLRRALHALGFRYRLHARDVPGSPDLVLPRFRAVIFVHGCFWHRHQGCRYATTPSTRPEFWKTKFAANMTRDRAVRTMLRCDGWRVAIVWECALRKSEQTTVAIDQLTAWLATDREEIEIGGTDIGDPRARSM